MVTHISLLKGETVPQVELVVSNRKKKKKKKEKEKEERAVRATPIGYS